MNSEYFWLIPAFFAIALIYSSAGFGGGSSYLALLAIPVLALTPAEIRPTALLCNLIVVTNGVIQNLRAKVIPWPNAGWLLVFSIPMAGIGSMLPLKENTFFLILGLALLMAAIALFFQPTSSTESRPLAPGWLGLLGGSIGFLSGLVGIGGGIFLAPCLHFLRWNSSRTIAAMAGLYILVNSVSSLAGLAIQGMQWPITPLSGLLGLAVFCGGLLGTQASLRWLPAPSIRRITAALIFVAAIFILKDRVIG